MKKSKKWIKNIIKKDKYLLLAKKKNIRSRAWFKLYEINKKYNLLKKNNNIIELGCYPGSWSILIKNIIGKNGKIFSCDILNIKPIKNIIFIKGDICKKKTLNKILKKTKKTKIKIILSDISPNLTGIKEIDNIKYKNILKKILFLCKKKLNKNGNLLIKLFLGENFSFFIKKTKKIFKTIKIIKPKASRTFSKEIYLIALGFNKKIFN